MQDNEYMNPAEALKQCIEVLGIEEVKRVMGDKLHIVHVNFNEPLPKKDQDKDEKLT